MMTECNEQIMLFQGHRKRRVEVEFDGGKISSDAGAVLLREFELKESIMEEFAKKCFADYRDPTRFIAFSVEELINKECSVWRLDTKT